MLRSSFDGIMALLANSGQGYTLKRAFDYPGAQPQVFCCGFFIAHWLELSFFSLNVLTKAKKAKIDFQSKLVLKLSLTLLRRTQWIHT